ncbi:hypothetical protein RclHR1_02380009 [Rhizophagus clarus]|uniref:Ubiquitin-related domain-containing protein n=1 Tax=Rhizophagus clarus TaxID=94130 RepID=A0A2Z6QWZ5_9GLOM|nr:hypothetical protein RclHR1_02380009 [Rhizophagus clarus]GES78511.1 ubiquitin-related domain-containing protein [Rhizophagus clarus]
MSELALVAAAISSIINCPVKTYDECVADGLEVLPNKFLDLDLVHKYSFVREGDDKAAQKPSFRQGDEKDEEEETVHSQDGKKDEKVINKRSRKSGDKDEKVINRRSRQSGEKDEKIVRRYSKQGGEKKNENLDQVTPDTNNLPPQPIQIFVKTSFGKSHSMFVAPNSSVLELKQAIQKKLYIDRPIRLGFSHKFMNDRRTLESYNIKRGDTIHILFRVLGGSDFYIIKDDFISPQFSFDFTELEDDGTVYTRGKELYKRPYGWRRIALNINKYGNTDWLGSSGNCSAEWPVTYHGTKREFADSIAENGYLLSKGHRFAYGRGIYSTPDIAVAEEYAKEFRYDDTDYKVVFQNRVNPKDLKKADTGSYHGEYWITPDEKDIRPYGLCIKKFY